MCDQLRHDWLGYAGAEHVSTPHIDRIAARGTVFTQAVCNSPVCAPSRIGLACGLRPHRMGALDNNVFLPLSRPTYYQRLRDHGYHVGCVGKLDLAKPDRYNGREGNRPVTYAWGFTHPLECEGKMHAGSGDPPNGPYTAWLQREHPELHAAFIEDYRTRSREGYNIRLGESVLPYGYCEDDFIGERAVRQLRAFTAGEWPWHLFVSFVGPHDPFDPAPEFYQRFRDANMPAAIPWNVEGKPPRYHQTNPRYRDPNSILAARRLYTAYLAQIDEQIGRLLDALEQSPAANDTFVVFASDHGEMLGDHGRYTKSVHYESSVRVPLILAGPGIPIGNSDALVELNDLNPTFCELADIQPAANIDARSLVPLLKGAVGTHRDFTFSSLRGHHCVRTREWKFIYGDDGNHELYHLSEDPREEKNLITEQPGQRKTMHNDFIHAWAEEGPHR